MRLKGVGKNVPLTILEQEIKHPFQCRSMPNNNVRRVRHISEHLLSLVIMWKVRTLEQNFKDLRMKSLFFPPLGDRRSMGWNPRSYAAPLVNH